MTGEPDGEAAGDGLGSPSRELDRAIALHRQGRLAEAERDYARLLAAEPGNVVALHHLGILKLQAEDAATAVELIRRAIGLGLNSAAAHADLATALNVLRRHDEAVTCYEDALTIDPDRAETHYGLGIALQALARTDEAASCLQRAVVIDPDYAEAHCALACALQAQKRFAEAIASYRAALAVDPDYAEALCGLATALHAAGGHTAAIAAYEQVLARQPDHAEALNHLGAALKEAGRYDEALSRFERAIAIRPDDAEAHLNLGIALTELGRAEAARRTLERAIELEPGRPRLYFELTNATRGAVGRSHLSAMEALVGQDAALTPEEQAQLHFALAAALAEAGRMEQSFDHLITGNAIKRRLIRYEESEALALFERIARVFTPEMMRAKAQPDRAPASPIFIVGMPRSGSTLIEQLLASHPDVVAMGERADFIEAVKRAGADSATATFPESVPALSDARLGDIGTGYLAAVAAAAKTDAGRRFVDKTLINFCFAGLIHLALPDARIIHARRDPVDTCLSCYSKLFSVAQHYSYDLGELGRYYSGYARLMDHWRRVLPEGVMLEVQYEAVVDDFERQARRIVAHCGLDWNDACLSFHRTQRPIRTASALQVRVPVYATSIGRWRPSADVLRPLMEGLNGTR